MFNASGRKQLPVFAKKLATPIRRSDQNHVFRTSRRGRTNRSGWIPTTSRSSVPKFLIGAARLRRLSGRTFVAQGAAPSAASSPRTCGHPELRGVRKVPVISTNYSRRDSSPAERKIGREDAADGGLGMTKVRRKHFGMNTCAKRVGGWGEHSTQRTTERRDSSPADHKVARTRPTAGAE
jgi:hypothetical protein